MTVFARGRRQSLSARDVAVLVRWVRCVVVLLRADVSPRAVDSCDVIDDVIDDVALLPPLLILSLDAAAAGPPRLLVGRDRRAYTQTSTRFLHFLRATA